MIIRDYKCFAADVALVEANCTCHRRCFAGSLVCSGAILATYRNRMCTSQDRVGSFTVHCLRLIATDLDHSDCFNLKPMKRHGGRWLE